MCRYEPHAHVLLPPVWCFVGALRTDNVSVHPICINVTVTALSADTNFAVTLLATCREIVPCSPRPSLALVEPALTTILSWLLPTCDLLLVSCCRVDHGITLSSCHSSHNITLSFCRAAHHITLACWQQHYTCVAHSITFILPLSCWPPHRS